VARRGRGLHFGERECSVQRRHQKLVEETPALCLTPAQRRKLCETAVRGFLRVGYRNAGTAEFLYHKGKITFNEINARLQVEHPITEMVTLVDLVRQQILVASGEDPEVSQNEIQAHGHAMECRVNAEDPLRNFLPSPGRIVGYREPAGHGIRVDSGVAAGSVVPPFYDSLMAKLIVRGRTRGEVVERMARALADYEIRGLHTNLPFHEALFREAAFRQGDLWTTMIGDLRIVERMRGRGPREERIAAIAAALAAGPGLASLESTLPLGRATIPAWAVAGRRELHGGADAVPARRRW
jgi:pyruvate carboxylase subunit A